MFLSFICANIMYSLIYNRTREIFGMCLLGLIFLFHLTCSCPFPHLGHVFARLGNVLLSLSACPSFNLLMLLSLLFIVLIASFYLRLTLSSPSAHFTFPSPFPHRIPNKQTKRRDQHASCIYDSKDLFVRELQVLLAQRLIGHQRWEL